MSLNYPTFDDLAAQIRAEFRKQLPEVDPTVFGSWARAFADGNAVLAQSISFLVRDLEKELFPQTASGEFLDLWGGYEGLERKPESPSFGGIVITGTAGVVIPVLTDFTGSNGVSYQSTAVSTITAVNQSITTLTRSGSLVTAKLPSDHNLATGIEITVSGATQPEYNGTFTITIISRDEFQYTITSTPVSPATGSPEYDVNMASVQVEAQSNGLTTNLESGAQLSFVTPITNADDPGLVQFDGLTGGSSEETDEEYRTRILLSRSIIEGVFTPDQIKLAALSISGNTRAFVKKPTLSVCSSSSGSATTPAPGQTSVFILRDNDLNIIPSQSVLDATKLAIKEDGALPANTSEVDLFVEAPDLVETDFDFTALNPNTPTMRTAVSSQLEAFFEDTVDFEETVTEASYLGAIQGTQDLQTGEFIISFALSTPSGNIAVTDGEIASLGDVTFTI
jgi:uncharacterized phage protein gp47/JayE